MAKFFNIVMDDMEGGSSSDDNQPRKPSAAAKGKRPATTQIEWLTDSMVGGFINCPGCTALSCP